LTQKSTFPPLPDERESAKNLAKVLLDEPWADPDDDLRVLSRQLLRRHEEIERLTGLLSGRARWQEIEKLTADVERLTRQRDTYRNACATKQDLIDRILLQSVPGELSAERKAELRDRPRVTRAELAKSRLEVKRAERDLGLEPEPPK
jgi:hypothetical protein